MSEHRQCPLFALGVALAGCAAHDPVVATGGPAVRGWGTLRDALRDGRTEARVDVQNVASPSLVAVGAAAGLDGEITVLDGACFVSRAREGRVETDRSGQVAATLLFAADVPRWRASTVPQDLPASALAAFLVQCARDAGLDPSEPFPFVVDGELLELDMHVLAGECPTRARALGATMTSPPLRQRFDRVRGQLVGFHASHGQGVITHHGSTVHAHALVDGATWHCDTVGVAAGAVLRLPDVLAAPAASGARRRRSRR